MFNIYVPTEFFFGPGASKELKSMKLPGKKALIVTTAGKSMRRNGALASLENQLKEMGIEYALFEGINANPDKKLVMEGAKAARENGCDFIIALGGGSPMDAGKAIALMATNEGDLWDYCARGTGKRKVAPVDPLPLVCISTTAGTGSEADSSGMINNAETNEKFGIGDRRLFPVISIVDPELMVSVPPLQSAYQGLDAFFHLAEGFLSKKANLFNEMCAITGVRDIGKYLVRSIKDGSDLEAREHVAFANTLGGYVMSTGKLLSQHSLEHVMSAHHADLPHGAGLILLSRAYFSAFLDDEGTRRKYVELAKALGREDAKEPEEFIEVLDQLIKDCGVDDIRMQDWGITEEELPVLAKEAKEAFCDLFYNDPKMLSEEDCLNIYKQSFHRAK